MEKNNNSENANFRQEAEESLKASEKRYRRLFESAKDGILILDAETGMITDVNPFLIEMLGYSEYQFRDKAIWEIGFFKDIVANLDKFSELQHKEYVRYDDLPLDTADGRKISVEFISNIYFEENKKVIQCNIREKTIRKESELALRKSESHLRTLVSTIPDLVWLKDTNGVYLSCNPMFERLFGSREADIAGKTDYDFVDRELADSFRENDRKAIEAGKPTSNEEWVTFADDGHRAFLDTIKTPMYDSDGMLLGVLGIGRDITERKLAEEILHDSREDLSRLLNSMYEGAYGVDINGYCTFVNRACLQILGYQNDYEFLGKHIHELIHHSHYDGSPYPSSECRMYRAYQINQTVNVSDEVFWRKDGIAIQVEYWSCPIEKNGAVIGSIAAFIDITQRKLAEETLRLSEERYRFSLEITAQIGWSVPPDGLVEDMPLWRQYTGQSIEEVKGWKWLDSIHPDDREHTRKIWVNATHQKCKYETEYRIRRADGVYRYFMVRGIPLFNANGSVKEWVGSCIDITDRKQAEEKLIIANKELVFQNDEKEKRATELIIANEELVFQNNEKEKRAAELIIAKEKAQESDRLKSAFLANMSHEVRTPLNSIIGFSELLADPYFEEDQKNEFIQLIIASGNNLLNIISDIMDISKIESGEIKIHNSQINLLKFISNVEANFSLKAKEKNIELKLSIPENEEGTIIVADTDRLSQVMNNLIGNALKFTSVGNIEIGYQPKGKMVEFFVKDTGIGIPTEYHDQIFKRFRQVEGEKMRKFGGNGLGLAITKNLVELMGGKIRLESKIGEGSKFYFTMPMN
ncbi:MAG: PAS domain S-box protein [Bacteroidota bacterium]|nr:PAS domain S-box protein [Bacteroidota bacterium]